MMIARRSWLAACFWLLGLVAVASAKAPTLENLFPAGASRGSTVEVTATGQFERWPVKVWVSNPTIEVKPGVEKGKLTVTIAADAPPGLHWLRLFDDEGATSPRPFLVGQLPEVVEVEPNDEIKQAQPVVSTGLTINGRLAKTGDVDAFRVGLKKGQTLIASLEANRRLGSPMDGVLQVASAEGFVLAQNDDDQDRDPRIAFEASHDGDYLVRVFAFPFVQESSIRFAGAPGYIYRLTLTTGGWSDHAYPLSVTLGHPSEVEAVGWNIPGGDRHMALEALDDRDRLSIVHPMLAEPVEVQVVEEPSIVEVEPNDSKHPQPLALPVALSGRIDQPGDVDTFSFEARKDQVVVFRVDSRSIGQPLDAVLRVGDSSGATIVEVDDARKGVDPEVRFTPPSNGTFRVSIRDLNGQGSPRHVYLLTAGPPRPDFAITLKADPLAVTPGKPFDLVVAIERRENYGEPIEISLAEHYDSVIAPPVISRKGEPSATSVTLKINAFDCLKPGPIQVIGISRDGRRRLARVPVPGLTATIETACLPPGRAATEKPAQPPK